MPGESRYRKEGIDQRSYQGITVIGDADKVFDTAKTTKPLCSGFVVLLIKNLILAASDLHSVNHTVVNIGEVKAYVKTDAYFVRAHR